MKHSSIKSVLLVAAVTAITASFTSCTKSPLSTALNRALGQHLSMQTQTVEVVLPPYNDTTISINGSGNNYYDVDSFIRANTLNMFGVADIKSVKMMSCELRLTNPSQAVNFANFKSCSGSFYTNAKTEPYGVSVNNNADTYAETLTLPVDTTTELKDYLANTRQFTYSLGGRLRRKTTDSVHCTINFAFKIAVE